MSQEEGQVQEKENERDQNEGKEKAEQDAKDKNEKSEEGKSDEDGSPPEKESRFKGLKKAGGKIGKFGKNQAKKLGKKLGNEMVESDEDLKKIKDTASKIKKEAKRAKKIAKRGFKFIAWCVSNPLGWIVGLICLTIFTKAASGLTESMKKAAEKGDFASLSVPTPDDLGDDNQDEVDNQSDANTDGQKTTVILMDCGKKDKASGAASSTSSDGASDMDWTKEGTTAYKNAKEMFEMWTGEGGLSGEAAAGIIGWVQSEGGTGIVGRAEGHYGASLEENSIKFGVVPIPSTPKYSVGGGGIYQFTPYTEYGQLKEDKWEDAKTMTNWVN